MSLLGILAYAPIIELSLTNDGRFLKGQIHSFIQYRGKGPRLDKNRQVVKEIKRLTALDMPHTPLTIRDSGEIYKRE